MTLILSSSVAFVATVLLIFLLRPVAHLTGLVDIPIQRSSHLRATPLVGGLAIYIAVLATYLLLMELRAVPLNRVMQSYFLGAGLLVLVGIIDDYIRLSSLLRFIAQIIASLVMIYGGNVVITDIGAVSFSGDVIYLGWLSVPFTVFATLGIINALNMSDGLDGLSGSLALISLIGLMIGAVLAAPTVNVILILLLAASVLGFLMFNLRIFRREQASIFMGDAGSMLLGFSITWFAITLTQGMNRTIAPATALWFLMLPIFDTVAMIFRRLVRRRSPFVPDKEHIHHVLLMAGFRVNEAVAIMSAAALIGVGIGVLSTDLRVPEFSVAGLFVVFGLLYMWMILRAWKVMKFIERSIDRREVGADRRYDVERRSVNDPGHTGLERRFGKERRVISRRVDIKAVTPASEVQTKISETGVLNVGPRND